MGESEQTIIDRARQQRVQIPQRILDAPTLYEGLDWYYQAFAKLTTCRQLGMGSPGPIPWTAMNDFCVANGVSKDDQEEFEYLIEKMDDAYIKYVIKKQEKSQAAMKQRKPLTPNSRRR
jgi:hypothetical protein